MVVLAVENECIRGTRNLLFLFRHCSNRSDRSYFLNAEIGDSSISLHLKMFSSSGTQAEGDGLGNHGRDIVRNQGDLSSRLELTKSRLVEGIDGEAALLQESRVVERSHEKEDEAEIETRDLREE